MKRAALLLILCLAVFAVAACSSPGTPSSSQPESAPDSSSSAAAPAAEPSSSLPQAEPSAPASSSQEAPAASDPAVSSSQETEAVSQSQPVLEPADPEQVAALQQYLFDTLSQESYAYLNAGAQEGVLTIGCLDEAAVQAAIDGYTGDPCPTVLVSAKCSVAQTITFLEQINGEASFPKGAYVEPVSEIPGAFEGVRLGLHAASEEDAAAMEAEVLALAEKAGFPTDCLRFYHMTLEDNPDT